MPTITSREIDKVLGKKKPTEEDEKTKTKLTKYDSLSILRREIEEGLREHRLRQQWKL